MFTLIDKQEKKGYNGVDLGIIAETSGLSYNTLKSWKNKSKWFENLRYILFQSDLLKSNRGGLNEGNKKYFNV